ncbi:MAG: MBL fold metallo-hydrolase [Acidobacteria bacterium]|nr:MAG: MBL fold metallo-hydrolase [Acidobacteriota bacterium]
MSSSTKSGEGSPTGTGITWGLRPIEGGPSDIPLVPGELQELIPGVIRILAPNAGFFTGPGTNTYVVGGESAIVIDPAGTDESHVAAIKNAISNRQVIGVLATHHHSDHAPGAKALADDLGVPFMAHPAKLEPDVALADEMEIDGLDSEVVALHTPGHASDHICLFFPHTGLFFSGDHLMGGSTVVISPPDGDMAAYIDSVKRLKTLGIETIMPGHGQPIYEPDVLLDWYIAHRMEREEQVLSLLDSTGVSIVSMVAEMYSDIPEAAHRVAAMSVWAHLIKLEGEGRARLASGEGAASTWCKIGDVV